MKILLGILIGAGLFLGGTAFAETVDIHGVQLTQVLKSGATWGPSQSLRKFYDYDNGVVCYTVNQNGISCLKN